jgi:DNA mismatch repair protein MutL
MIELGKREEEWEGGSAILPLRVTGMVGSPAISRSSRGYLSFFVNRRWVLSRLLAWAVEEAYQGLLMSGKHPVAVVNISLPQPEVDVNIHPTKSEVKFRNERLVFSAVQKAVRQALIELAPIPSIEASTVLYEAPPAPRELPMSAAGGGAFPTRPPAPFPIFGVSLPVLRVLGQLLNSYIIAEGPDGLYLIDQHAAHERVLFEKIKEQRARQKVEVQGLLEPVTFQVNPRQNEVLKLHYDSLAEFGFSVEPFGDKTYLVRAVPALLYQKDWLGVVREVLDSPAGSDWMEGITITIACHSAVRAGQTLTDDEMRGLIRQLEQVASPHTCPHGRPTMIHLNSGRLDKEFGRS